MIQEQLAGSHQVVRRSLGEVSDDEAHRVLDDSLAPITWQVGHLAWADLYLLKAAGASPSVTLPDSFVELFKTGTGGRAAYPPLETVQRTFDEAHSAVMKAAADLDPDSPRESSHGLWKNSGGVLLFLNNHRWYHVGKMTSLRAMLGKPRVFG